MNKYINANDALTVPPEPSCIPQHLVLSHLGRCSTAYKKIKTKNKCVTSHTVLSSWIQETVMTAGSKYALTLGPERTALVSPSL